MPTAKMSAPEKVPYLKNEYLSTFSIIKRWQLFDGMQGATPVAHPLVGLRMDKAPPRHPDDPPPPKHIGLDPHRKKHHDKHSPEKPAKKEEKEEKKEEYSCKAPPPFDLQDISKGMDAIGWTKSAKFARRWFLGRKYIASNNPRDFYPHDMVDTQTITLNWLFGFKKVKEHYEELTNKTIYSDAAKATLFNPRKEPLGILQQLMKRHPGFSGPLDTWHYCKQDIQQLHRNFQFQRASVTTLDTMYGLVTTDLTGTLANFAFYAAIAKAHVSVKYYSRYTEQGMFHCKHPVVQITHVYVYAKDSYSFNDESGKHASQYLGHWNKYGLINAPGATLADRLSSTKFLHELGIDYEADNAPICLPWPLDIGHKIKEKDVYYPVRNRDFQVWREHHNRGGDFVVYSDLKLITLPNPMTFDLGETCWPAKK